MSEEQAKQFLDQATQSLQGGQFQQALELVEQAIALNESDEAQVLRGIALSQLGQADTATEAFRRAINLGPYNAKAYFNLAVHFFAQGKKAEALEMAREAVRIDSKHAGARDLIARIEAESTPDATGQPQMQRIDTDGPTGEAPQSSGPMAGPGAPQGPYQTPTQGGYYRPGYETSGVHSLQFVQNMGKSWDTFAWVLIVILFAGFAFQMVTQFGQIMEAFSNPEAMRRMQGMGFGTTALQVIISIVALVARLGALVWMILELTDRRGNWLWLLPYILCCCCGLDWLVMGIYLMAGRQK